MNKDPISEILPVLRSEACILARAAVRLKFMKSNLSRFMLFLLLVASYCVYLVLWQQHTGSGPERDAFKFYYPSLSLLYAAEAGIPISTLIENLSHPEYPWGYLLLPALLSLLSLGSISFENPIILTFVPTLAVAALVLLKSLDWRSALGLSLLVFTLPLSQVAIKGLSPHAMCVFLPLMGCLLLIEEERWKKVVAWVLFFVCAGFKHLGLLICVNVGVSGLLSVILGKVLFNSARKPWSYFWIPFSASIFGLIFYQFSGSAQYSFLLFEHLHALSELDFTVLLGSILILVIGVVLIQRKFKILRGLPCYEVETLTVLMLIYYVWALQNLHSLQSFVFPAILIVLICLRSLCLEDDRERFLYSLVGQSLFTGSLLYALGVGGTFYVLHFPFLVLFYLLVKRVKRFVVLLIVFFLILGNLFVKNDYFGKRYGESGRHFLEKAQEGVWNSFWSWYESPTQEVQTGFATVMEFVDFQGKENLPVLDAFLKVDLRTIALYHRNLFIQSRDVFPVDAAAPEHKEKWAQKIQSLGFEGACKAFLEENTFPVILEGLGEGRDQRVLKETSNSLESFGERLFQCYQTRGSLESHFQSYEFPSERPVLRVWVQRSVLRASTGVNPYLAGLLEEHTVEAQD